MIQKGEHTMIELTKETFEDEVLKAEGTVLVDFYGDGCVPCQALMPHVHAMEDTYGKDIKFTALNTTKARRLAIGQKILGLPVIALYKGGEKIAECVKDDATVENIEAMIKAHLPPVKNRIVSKAKRDFKIGDSASGKIPECFAIELENL